MMTIPKTRNRTLEKVLIEALVDSTDSDHRKRYVKKLIYGESMKTSKSNLSLAKRIRNFFFKEASKK